MEDHLRKKHTQDEIIREMTEHHWDAMIPSLKDDRPKKRKK
jgi:hypothetical protein